MNKWSDTTLGAVTDIRVSNVDKKTLFGERPVHLCNYMDVYSTNSVTPERVLMPASATEPEFQRFRLFPGDVVVTKDSESPDDIAVPTYIEPGIGEDVVCGYHLAILRPKAGLNGKFLSYLLRLPEVNLHFARSATGSTRFGLSLKALHDAPLRIPDSEREQLGIADVLSALDEQIDAVGSEIMKQKSVLDGLLDRLLLDGLRDCKLGDYVEISPNINTQMPSQMTPFIPMESVSEDGHIYDWSFRPWSEVSSGFTRFSSGDVLVAKITPCFENGKGAQVPIGIPVGAGSTEFHVLRAKQGVCPRWIYWHTRVREFRIAGAGRMTGSAGQQRVPRDFIESFAVKSVSEKEQIEISRP